MLKGVEKETPPDGYLVVDAGNLLFKTTTRAKNVEPALNNARGIALALDASHTSAVAVGEVDLAYGLEPLVELDRMVSYPFLSANLVDTKTGERPFAPSLRLTVANQDLLIVGVTRHQGVQVNYYEHSGT